MSNVIITRDFKDIKNVSFDFNYNWENECERNKTPFANNINAFDIETSNIYISKKNKTHNFNRFMFKPVSLIGMRETKMSFDVRNEEWYKKNLKRIKCLHDIENLKVETLPFEFQAGLKDADVANMFYNEKMGYNRLLKLLKPINTKDPVINNKNRMHNEKVKADRIEYNNKVYAAYSNCIKTSLMYVWQFGVESSDGKHYVFMGRTWKEFKEFMLEYVNRMQQELLCDLTLTVEDVKYYKKCKFIVYVHNLGFEMQHLRNLFNNKISGVFAAEARKPLKFTISICKNVTVEFRDSYILTGKSLKNWCKDEELEVKKLTEEEDFYDPIYTPNTELEDYRIDYCVNDVDCMLYGLKKYRTKYGNLEKIPMTATGEIKIETEDAMKNAKKWLHQMKEINETTTYEEYCTLRALFAGGYTHVNAMYSGKMIGYVDFEKDDYGMIKTDENNQPIIAKNRLGRERKYFPIKCFDFTSSYPWCFFYKFPVTKFEESTLEELEKIRSEKNIFKRDKRFFVEIEADSIESKYMNSFWSLSKTTQAKELTMNSNDNGRIHKSGYIHISAMTDLDFEIFVNSYEIENLKIIKCYVAEADYLPEEFLCKVLDEFAKKQSLKGDSERASEYAKAKAYINSLYGLFCKRVIQSVISFGKETGEKDKTWHGLNDKCKLFDDDNITAEEKDKIMAEMMDELVRSEYDKVMLSKIKNENKNWNTYQIGCWVPAFGRFNLWSCIVDGVEIGELEDGSKFYSGSFDEKTIYFDTDSVKGLFTDEDLEWFEKYNENIKRHYKVVAKERNLDVSKFSPTRKGCDEDLSLGIWDREPDCAGVFLRAKAYFRIYEKYNMKKGIMEIKRETTIAGLPKSAGQNVVQELSDFRDGAVWNCVESNKKTAFYNDDQPEYTVIDKDGNKYICNDKYGICVAPVCFDLSRANTYNEYIEELEMLLSCERSVDAIQCYDTCSSITEHILGGNFEFEY